MRKVIFKNQHKRLVNEWLLIGVMESKALAALQIARATRQSHMHLADCLASTGYGSKQLLAGKTRKEFQAFANLTSSLPLSDRAGYGPI